MRSYAPSAARDAEQRGVDPDRPPLPLDERPPAPSRLRRVEPWLWSFGAIAAFLVAWQLVVNAHLVPELFLPGPIAISAAMVDVFHDPGIWNDLRVSGEEFALGYLLAIVVGLPLGLLTGRYQRLSWSLDPFIAFFYAMPRIALVPLLIIWFGIGIYSKVAVVFLGAFFPIAINTIAGIRSLDGSLLRAAHSFGASELQIFRTIALPGSVPFILTGLRLGLGHALVGIVVGELIAAQAGVAYEMSVAGTTFQMPKMFAYLVLISLTGVALTLLLQRLERKFDAWRPHPS
ncbi:MAG TPA: ABC transporter permease [Candidatus Dormibacteraeota bacterium]